MRVTTVEKAKDGQCFFVIPRIATDFAAVIALLVFSLLIPSAKAATFTPYFYDVLLTNRVDLDGDGYARQFDLLFDVDSNIAGQFYVKIYEYDGGFGFDDLLGTTATYAVNGTETDYRGIRIECSNFPGSDLLSHGTAEFRLDLFNAGNNTLIQSWTPSNDPHLGNVSVELASEDYVPVLTIAAVSPSGPQMRGWGQAVTYTVTVRDTNGTPVSGATVLGTNSLIGMSFTTSPATTDVGGLISYTATVPVCAPNGVYNITFMASKPGYLTSQPAVHQIEVNQPANRPPTASAATLSGQPSVLRVGAVYSITADYADPDGGVNDLRFCLLRLGHPTTPLAFRYEMATGTVQAGSTNLQSFLSPVSVKRTDIANGVRLTWHFFLKRTWPLASGQIHFSVGAEDRCGLTDGWNSDGRSLPFENPPYGCTLIIHGYQAFWSSVPEWVRTMGGRIAERLGNGEVYEYTPASSGFVRLPELSVGTNAAFEKVFLFNWADESDNLSSGYPEAAADSFFAALVRAQQATPNDHFLGRIHVIGHSRGCIVSSEIVERLRSLSRSGEDTNLFDFPVDTQVDVTYLDPHTTGTTLTGDFGDPNTNLPYLNRGVVVWSNVGHANNYFQTVDEGVGFPYLNGEYVLGSRNRNLDVPTPVGIDHSEVHAWFFGTIDPEATQDELAAMIAEEKANVAAAGLPFEEPMLVEPALASVTITRAQWYQDRKGIIEGYAHTRRGGEISHDESLEPLDATPRQEAFHDLIIDGIFNGGFRHGAEQTDGDMPAWDRHSGGGEGQIDAGHLRLRGDAVFPNRRYRRHNLLFIPSTAEKVSFRFRVYQADTRQPPSADRFMVKLGTNVVMGAPGNEVWLNQSSLGFKAMTCEVPPQLRGTVSTLTFEIVPGSSGVNAEVWVDDATWLDDSYLRLYLTRLPGGQTQLDLRGKLLSRYSIEASPNLSAWSQLALVTNTTGAIRFIDSSPGEQRRFYRAVMQP